MRPMPVLCQVIKVLWHVGCVVFVHVIVEATRVTFVVDMGGWVDNNPTLALAKEEIYGG